MTSHESNVSAEEHKDALNIIGNLAREEFSKTHDGREQALRLSREVIRNSANSIRATHRAEFDNARELIATITKLADEMKTVLIDNPAVYRAGFVEDAQKEYVEACATLAFAESSPLPSMDELGVGAAAYLNGLADAVGELRRFILDSLRRDDFSRCEDLLGIMDEVYTLLVTIDYPDAVTRGLRRSTDMVRGVLERTRGDLTVTLRQHRLEQTLASMQVATGEINPQNS